MRSADLETKLLHVLNRILHEMKPSEPPNSRISPAHALDGTQNKNGASRAWYVAFINRTPHEMDPPRRANFPNCICKTCNLQSQGAPKHQPYLFWKLDPEARQHILDHM